MIYWVRFVFLGEGGVKVKGLILFSRDYLYDDEINNERNIVETRTKQNFRTETPKSKADANPPISFSSLTCSSSLFLRQLVLGRISGGKDGYPNRTITEYVHAITQTIRVRGRKKKAKHQNAMSATEHSQVFGNGNSTGVA